MMNSDVKARAREKVEIMSAKLDHTLIKSQFDGPIDDAARHFKHTTSLPMTHRAFHEVIAEFVVQIYDKGLNARWMLSGEPLGHAIDLLEDYYQGSYGRGYIAATLDANDPEEGGVDAVLNRLAEIIKDAERLKYIQAVFIVNIDPTDWYLKCEIVRILLEYYRPFLPKHLLRCKPWELANTIPSIMYRYICSDTTLQQVLSFPEQLLTIENLFTL